MDRMLFFTIDGVLNTRESQLQGVQILPEKVLLLQSIVESCGARPFLFNPDKRQLRGRDGEKVFYNKMFKMLGLRYGVVDYFVGDGILTSFVKKNMNGGNRFCFLTAENSMRGLKGVIYTNREYGLMDSDIREAESLLRAKV